MDSSGKRTARYHESPGQAKKAKSDSDNGFFLHMLAEGGCTTPGNSEPVEVEDPRALRRCLLHGLGAAPEAVAAFTSSMHMALSDQAMLKSALLPMQISTEGVPETGDSLVRLLLNVTGVQTALACFILRTLPKVQETAGSQNADSMPQLILGSLRWLDEVVDAHTLTLTLLEVMAQSNKSVQQGILDLLPEVILEEDCEAVIAGLVQMTDSNSTLLVPVLEAISNITAQDAGQAQVTELVLQRFQSAELGDLPALLRFLLQHVNPQNASQVVELLRCSMPPLGNSAAQESGEMDDVEEAAVEAMRTGLQCSHLAADTVFSQIKALTDPDELTGLDMWLLLLLASLAGKRCEAVQKLLKKKFAEGHAKNSWLDKAVCTHQGALRSLFPMFLGLAGQLVQAGQAGPQGAGSHLYTLLFAAHPTPQLCQAQEILAGLHGHLGSGQAGEISTALAVLLSLTHSHACQLLQHADFLSSLLDCLHSFSQAQLHQVFEVVSELVVLPKAASAEVESNRQRLGQQLEALLCKQMQSGEAHAQRVGIIGTTTLAERLANPSPHGQRSKEAEELLGRSFEVRQHNPVMFALLCDEITDAVVAGRMSEPLREWLKLSATDQLEGFLDDFTDSPADVQCKGGKTMTGANWMNLNGSAGQVMLPLLRILSSPDQLHRHSLAYLCAVTRLALTLEFQTIGNLEGLSAILGCPLHMPHLDQLQTQALLTASPDQQQVACTSLLLAINWIRELLNAWAHHVQPQGCLGGVEVQQNLLVRLQNLCQLEALLAHTLALLPNPPSLHVVPNTSPPALHNKMQKKGKTAKKGKAPVPAEEFSEPADDQENLPNNPGEEHAAEPRNDVQALSRMPEVQGQLRPLDPHVLHLLGQVQCAALPRAALAPAALLMEELHGKLVEAMTRARRPAFLTTAQNEPTGSQQSPQKIWHGLQSIFPALHALLISCNALSLSGQDELSELEGVLTARVEGASQDRTAHLLLTGHPIATAALAPAPAAARVLQQGLHCIQQLTASDWLKQPQHHSVLHAFIRAFRHQPNSPSQNAVPEEMHQLGALKALEAVGGCLQSVHSFKGLSKGAQGSLQQEVALLHTQANLIAVAESIPGDAAAGESLSAAKEGVSSAAEQILQQGSDPQPSEETSASASAQTAEPQTMGGGSWKAQQGVIGDLIHLWVPWSPQPCRTILGLSQGALAQVPCQPLSGKKAQEPVHPYPGLCGSSLHVWYKALFQELLQQWSSHGNSVVALHKSRQGPLRQEGAEAALAQLKHCGRAFASLLTLNKVHLKRIQMHAQALRCGSKVIQHCMRTLPFWEAWYAAHPNQVEPFSKALRDVQSGTRILYVICAEGKANKNLTIANLVVGTKHVLEEFRVGVTAVMLAAKQQIMQGNLKHKDLTGQEVGSQVPFTQVVRSDIDEDMSDAEQAGQEEAGYSDTE